jgi:hypothetical protein
VGSEDSTTPTEYVQKSLTDGIYQKLADFEFSESIFVGLRFTDSYDSGAVPFSALPCPADPVRQSHSGAHKRLPYVVEWVHSSDLTLSHLFPSVDPT